MLHHKSRHPDCTDQTDMVPHIVKQSCQNTFQSILLLQEDLSVMKREKTPERIDNPDDSDDSTAESSGSRQRVVSCN